MSKTYQQNLEMGYNALGNAIKHKTNYIESYYSFLKAAVHFSEAKCAVGLLAVLLNSQHVLPSVMESINNLNQ